MDLSPPVPRVESSSVSFNTEGAPQITPKRRKTVLQALQSINWTWDILAISIVYMVEGFTDLAVAAVQYYMKDAMKLGPAEAGILYTVFMLPWNMTPLMGLTTDSVPIFGYHRKAYLIIVGLLGSVSWFTLPHSTSAFMVTCVVFCAQLASSWSQVVADAVTVKLSQRQEMEIAAMFQSLSWITYTVGGVISGYLTGHVLEVSGPSTVFRLLGVLCLVNSLCGTIISEHREPGMAMRHQRKWWGDDDRLGDEDTALLRPSVNTVTAGANGHAGAAQRPRPGLGWKAWIASVWVLIKRLWATLRQPHIFGAALFIFAWQSTPAATSAMFFFNTNVLGFSPSFMSFMYLCGTTSGFLGVAIYNVLLVHKSLRGTLLWASLIGTLLNASQLLLVSRVNIKLGLSDKLFALGDYSMLNIIAEVMLTPMLALAARICPDGIEATLSATLYSLLNISRAISSASGVALTSAFGVTDTDFQGMFGLTLTCNLLMLLPLFLLMLIPRGSGVSQPHTEDDGDTHTSNRTGHTSDTGLYRSSFGMYETRPGESRMQHSGGGGGDVEKPIACIRQDICIRQGKMTSSHKSRDGNYSDHRCTSNLNRVTLGSENGRDLTHGADVGTDNDDDDDVVQQPLLDA